ncbi:GNAT family N-acetyltransferase [Paenibacillus popilliae]|uniref:GNAT family N-acetyltransferase n=1 Tax=Paenibacillus popilliae TaxID=78057 RepID=A0ABY3AIY1_PAEPP|nr:GNAT family N-acetyltransferase [Paenibacillus sp. SDF0028]TQR42175.1 GNAT family N-acetyltransferase [Paenibacillus sp. SDF0028]
MEIRYESELPTPEEIYELYEYLQWNTYLGLSQEKLLKAMQQSYCAIYAYHEDQLIGTGRIISDGIINAYLCGLGVHPDYRGQGIGTAISRLLMEQCSNHNLHLQFFCEEELVPYYERLGFTVFAVGMKPANKRYCAVGASFGEPSTKKHD